jgi:lipopolysaccharide transport system ATP-binding protein
VSTNAPVLIDLAGVGKDYPLLGGGSRRVGTLLALLAGRASVYRKTALDDITLQVRKGESLGLIGENGAGKSTLLKVIAGVVKASRGTCHVNGRVGALLELGSGFHPEYTGRENIALAAALGGLSKRDVAEREGAIVEFADIGAYIDEPVKHYSSGMVVRLGFAVATALVPQVLITDEVLAVGDESFQRKCIRWMERFLGDGGTLLLCSHSLYHVQTLCRRAAWLHKGRIKAEGDSFTVTQDYLAWHEEKQRAEASSGESPFGDREAYAGEYYALRSLTLGREGGAQAAEFAMGDTLEVRAEMHSPDDVAPVALVGIRRGDGSAVFGTHSNERGFVPQRIAPNRFGYVLRFPRCALLPGKYLLLGHALDPQGLRLFDTIEIPFVVRGATRDYGFVELEHEWRAPGREG